MLVNTVLGQTFYGRSEIQGFRIRDGTIAWYAICSSLPDALRAAGRLE